VRRLEVGAGDRGSHQGAAGWEDGGPGGVVEEKPLVSALLLLDPPDPPFSRRCTEIEICGILEKNQEEHEKFWRTRHFPHDSLTSHVTVCLVGVSLWITQRTLVALWFDGRFVSSYW
jgi:hypothetical protein